ncbi:MAG: RNA methyltransferase [Armatimonadota bacterium]|nr:RNA methyltransferase [bacterium]MDW8290504.1 RNA methyltransferase [Armatimonadota bacterium]
MQLVDQLKHPAFRAACRLTEPAPREAERRFLMEGASAIAKALRAPLRPLEVYIKEETEPELAAACEEQGIPVYSVRKGLFHRLLVSSYETSTAAVAVMPWWEVTLDEVCSPCAGIVLVAERIQDPRNLGMLIRTADAAQVRALVLASPLADPYSRASVRSSTGSIAFLPVVCCKDSRQVIEALRQHSWRLVGSSAHAQKVLWEEDLSPPFALWVGNEETGLLSQTREAMDTLVRIPMGGGAQSLNVAVATGIMLFEAVRRIAHAQPVGENL